MDIEKMGDREQCETEELWVHMIKNRCFLCGEKIENSWHRYQIMGNCCGSCSTWCGMSKQKKRVSRVKSLAEWQALTPKQRVEETAYISSKIRK